MVSLTKSLYLPIISIVLITTKTIIAQAQSTDFLYHFCQDKIIGNNFTTNSTYHTNLNRLLSTLPSNVDTDSGFYNSSYGQNSDQVHAIGLCRGDIQSEACRSCLNDSTIRLTELCPNRKEALGWYVNCMLRYSNRSIFGLMEEYPRFCMWNVVNVSSYYLDGFKRVRTTLLENLKNQAAAGGSLRKYAIGNATAPNSKTIYALAQCTPDLSAQECTSCLDSALGSIPQCNCDDKEGGRVVTPSCNFRFEVYKFYEGAGDTPPPTLTPTSPPSLSPPSLSPPSLSLPSLSPPSLSLPSLPPPSLPPTSINTSITTRGKKSNTSRTVISSVVPIVVFTVLIMCIYIYSTTMKAKESVESVEEIDDESAKSLQFEFGTIRAATDNFSDANKLGQGGFGAVYKGRLSNGQEIAVKRLSKNSGQGDTEFKNEILLLARQQHRNLVSLLGFCFEKSERLLIYEFVRNSSLDHHVFDPIKRAHLDWNRRYKIIVGIARGLLYLHEDSRLKIIHRDLKASNILLDAKMNPKISDFGMAKLFDIDQTQGDTTRIVGTYGYMAPEYIKLGHFSVKSDVYSFGVLVLEIVSGQSINKFCKEGNADSLLNHAWKKWRQGKARDILDPKMKASGSISEIMRCIHIGLLCVQEKLADRPNMALVGLMLSSHSVSLRVPSKPAYYIDSSTGSCAPNSRMIKSDPSQKNSLRASENEASITELYPR